MTSNLEKVFMHHILANPALFGVVEPHYFKNAEVRFVYDAVRTDYQRSKKKLVPSLTEIADLVTNADRSGRISMDLLKSILKVDMTKYREDDFIKPRFAVWIEFNKFYSGLADTIEQIRSIKEETDYVSQSEILGKCRELMNSTLKIDYTDDDLGSDFDDPASHDQDSFHNKLPIHWPLMNALVGGGFDIKTLNVLMGQTNVGKSLWLHNLAANAADLGFNVLIVSLEMSEKKVHKRLGSKRLKIPVKDYDQTSRDREFMRQRIDALKRKLNKGGAEFREDLGKIYVKEFPAGTLTVAELDSMVKKVQEVTGRKLHMVVVDYIGIMAAEKVLQVDSMLYLKGKHMAEGLRSIAQKYELVMVTATQLDKSKFDALDINLQDMPESRAIADTADTVWAIIRTPAMKVNKQYHLKALKLRDSDFQYDRIGFELDGEFLNITERGLVESYQPQQPQQQNRFNK